MRFQRKSTIAYLFRNFWQLVYVTLPVSALLAVFYNPSAEISLFRALISGEMVMDSYLDGLIGSLTVMRHGSYWWVALIGVVCLAFAMSVMVVKLDRHMRMGNMPGLPIRRAFGIFPHVLAYVAGWVVAYELFMLIVVGISYMIAFVKSATAIVAIAFALSFVARVFLAYMFGLLIITIPLKYCENYRFNIAMSYSARTMSARRRQVVALAFAYAVLRYAVMAVAYLAGDFAPLVYAAVLTLAFMFVPVYGFKKFYDDVGGERRDIREILFD